MHVIEEFLPSRSLLGTMYSFFIYFILKRKKCLLLIIYTVLFTQPLISMQVCSLKKIDILDSNATCRQVLTTFDMHNNFKMMDHYGTVTAHSKSPSIFFSEFYTSRDHDAWLFRLSVKLKQYFLVLIIYSEKTKKLIVKTKTKIAPILVAFSENLNFSIAALLLLQPSCSCCSNITAAVLFYFKTFA